LAENELSSDVLLAALALVRLVQEAHDLASYRGRVLGLRELVPCDAIGYNEVELTSGETFVVLDPPDAGFDGVSEAFGRFAHQHPVLRHHAETGDPRPRALSDFLSADELHALDLYRAVYEPMGAEDQLSFILPSPPGMAVGIALNRSTRGFGEAERELIELIRPHLTQAFRDAQMRDAADPLAPARLRELGLTDREAEVMPLLVEGFSATDVSERLSISPHTARHHIAAIYEKLGVSTRAAAVAAVLRAAPRLP
jgi:DNA-binding CsgD family transcriptional regulator